MAGMPDIRRIGGREQAALQALVVQGLGVLEAFEGPGTGTKEGGKAALLSQALMADALEVGAVGVFQGLIAFGERGAGADRSIPDERARPPGTRIRMNSRRAAGPSNQ